MAVHYIIFAVGLVSKCRSQITLFILLGLVVLIIIALLLVFVMQYASDRNQQNIDQSIRVPSGERFYHAAVESCVDTVVSDYLYRILVQGGVLYMGQGGIFSTQNTIPLYYQGEIVNVSYGIFPPEPLLPAPNYPYGNPSYSVDRLEWLVQSNSSLTLFGTNRLPALCDMLGPNRLGNPYRLISCPLWSYGLGERSIQRQLHSVIIQELGSCLVNSFDDQVLPDALIRNLTIQFTEREVVVVTDYYSVDRQYDAISIISLPARIARLYQLAHRLIERDIRFVRFDMNTDYRLLSDCMFGEGNSFCWDPDITVNVMKNVVGRVDVVQIQDRGSYVGGNHLTFHFAVPNRPPMLDYIRNIPHAYPHPDVHIAVQRGNSLVIVPYGYDPDGDVLEYTYEGWGQDYRVIDGEQVAVDVGWMNSSLYTDGGECGGIVVDKRCAEFVTDDQDVGNHTVRVIVSDGIASDYQDVRVEVY